MECLDAYKKALIATGKNAKQQKFIEEAFTRWFINHKLDGVFPAEPLLTPEDLLFAKTHHGHDFANMDVDELKVKDMHFFEEFQRCIRRTGLRFPNKDNLITKNQLLRLRNLYTGQNYEDDKNALINLYEFIGMNNMHLSIPPIFEGVELFGSPLNTHNPQFCSPFPLEKSFGSLGSFFEYRFHKDGIYLCNPPFDEDVMERMANRLLEMLDKTEFKVAIIITIPIWDSESQRKFGLKDYGLPCKGFSILKNSNRLLDYSPLDKFKFAYYNYYTGWIAPASFTHLLIIGNAPLIRIKDVQYKWLNWKSKMDETLR